MNANQLAAAIRSREVAAHTGVSSAHEAICARNPELNALVDYDPSASLPQLVALERRVEAGSDLPLAGVPVAVKDHFLVKGWRCTEGSRLFRDRVAGEDEPIVKRLREAGAILVGRSNMSEFGCKGVTTNLLYGPTRHPLCKTLTPGGSSGGAASAVAAGLVPLALASDGGGSVRRPAAHVGIVGFKPSAGAVADPRNFSHTSVFGCMARTVAETAMMFAVMAGADPRDPVSQLLPEDTGQPVKAMRIAFSPRLGLDVEVDDEVAACVSNFVDRLGAAGLSIERCDPYWPPEASEAALMPIQHGGLASAFGQRWREEPQIFDPDIGAQIERGLALSGIDLCRAQELSLRIARAAAAFFAEGYDLLISPTTPCVAWPLTELGPRTIGGKTADPRAHAVFTPFFNHAFCPAVSIPVGYGRKHLPIGLQIVGPRFSDWKVLRAASFMEGLL